MLLKPHYSLTVIYFLYHSIQYKDLLYNILAYYKQSSDGKNKFICVVNLDPHNKQKGFLQTPLEKIGKLEGESFYVHDLLNDGRWEWNKRWNFVELDPAILPCHLFRIEEA